MARYQSVLSPLTRSATFLSVTIDAGGEDTVRGVLSDVGGLVKAIGFRDRDGMLGCVVGIGSGAWDRLFAGPRPPGLHELPVFAGAVHTSVTTPADLLFHIRAERADLCFEMASKLMDRLRGAVTVTDETVGFRYWDNRDLLGFVDGTENPVDSEAVEAVFGGSPVGAPFADGSYVIVQKYLHDLDAWNALSTEEQERIIGRTKLDDLELDQQPAGSHVAANTIVDPDGTEQDIVRDNMPFGSAAAGEFGTYFIGYCRTPSVIERMLTNMFCGDDAGNTDRILDFSTPVTGALFHVPSADFFDDLPAAPAPSVAVATSPDPNPPSDGSLSIGSLNRRTTS